MSTHNGARTTPATRKAQTYDRRQGDHVSEAEKTVETDEAAQAAAGAAGADGAEGAAGADGADAAEPVEVPVMPAPPEVLQWMRDNAVALDGAASGSGIADMMALKSAIGDARIVSLGEATHGTREFFQLKHRFLEFLVEEMGFTAFGIEATFPESLAVNRYVHTGEGDPADAVASMRFWTWDTEEVVEMVRWMRAYNEDATHARKISFYGFDMQAPTVAALVVLDFLGRVDPAVQASVSVRIAPLSNDFSVAGYKFIAEDAKADAAAAIADVLAAFDANESDWSATTSDEEWRLARLHAVVLAQAEELWRDPTLSFAHRDRSMAENVGALMAFDGPDAKMVLWAHNGHAQRASYAGQDIESMGGHLHRMFGADHVVVGFSFNQGSFQAMGSKGEGLVEFTVEGAPEHSLDAVGALVGPAVFAVDLRTAPSSGPVHEWLASKPRTRSIGALFGHDVEQYFLVPVDPRDNFDIVVFVETTNAARRNPTAVRPPVVGMAVEATPKNLDFADLDEDRRPVGWTLPAQPPRGAHTATLASDGPDGAAELNIARAESPWRWGDGIVRQAFDAAPYRGARVRFEADIRAEAPVGGGGLIGVTARRPAAEGGMLRGPETVAHADSSGAIVREGSWSRRSVELDIPDDATEVVVAMLLAGNGDAWFANLAVS
jgi:erythromycin esterase